MTNIKHILFLYLVFNSLLFAEYRSSISNITTDIKKRMIKGNSWRKGCPVFLDNLCYLRIKHINFKGQEMMGELIVHKDISKEVVKIFASLYKMGYPIYKMKLVSDYKGNDWQSIEAGNTSAFNCRNATGSKKWSKHSYGKAIDVNPIENPYIARFGRISHKASLKYIKRVHTKNTYADKAMLVKGDKAIQIFKKYSWEWGGDWLGVKDYQHFSQ